MKYLLDTDTLIDFLKDRGAVRSRLLDMIAAGDEIALCPITTAEVYSGLNPADRVKWQEFLASLPFWAISHDAAVRAGVDRYTAARAGKTITTTDALIGALAREEAAVVLTSNVKDYPLDDVRVRSLREYEAA